MGTCNFLKRFGLLVLAGTVASCSQQEFSIIPSVEETKTEIPYSTEVDVLFVVDTSATMNIHQRDLSRQAGYFIEALDNTKLDYRIAVTTMDMRLPQNGGQQGAFVGSPRVLTSTTPSVASILEARLSLMGEAGSPVERGLEAMMTALDREADLPSSDFLRSDALLVTIFLTNEDDASSDVDYVGYLDTLKPPLPSGERSWVSHFIGVLPDEPSCDVFFGSYIPGYRYMELSEASGGVMENICTADLRSAVGSIRARVIQYITDVRLDRIPEISSIKVYVNGVEIDQDSTNGWTYVAEFNLVRFHGEAIPTMDARVVVDYEPLGIKQ